jgi:hypothetical protein
MAILTIDVSRPQLGQTDYGAGRLPAAFVARARQLLDVNGAVPVRANRHEMVLTLGGEPTEIAVEPGLWGVELILPTGELLNEQTRVEEDGEQRVCFELGESPREWLGWQFAEGTVPERRAYEAQLERGTRRFPGPRRAAPRLDGPVVPFAKAAALRKSLGSPVVTTDAYARPGVFAAQKSRSQVTMLRFLPQELKLDSNEVERFGRALELWKALVSGLRLEASILDLAGLEQDEGPGFLPGQNDPWHDVWRLGSEGWDEQRRFAMVVTNRAVEFVSLPLPWSPDTGIVDNALLELMIDKRDVVGGSRTSVTLRDQEYFGLLSYLKTGSLALAASVAQRGAEEENMLVDVLEDKRQNPLAACASGYALLGAIDLTRERSWYTWLANLNEWFPWLPDGAILHGRWLTLSGRGNEDEARQAFLRAFRRGIPFYSLGLSWLLEGLRQFGRDPECVEAARLVRQVSLRSDVGQVFTVLRLHATGDLPATGDQ